MKPSRLATLDILRGVAALSVSWFHFTDKNPSLDPSGALRLSGSYGWLGVEIFFVISGFVIPLSLAAAKYSLRDYPIFLARRIVRLEPAYLAAIAITVALGFASAAAPTYSGSQYHVAAAQLIIHAFYLTDLVGNYPWINQVYWTLAIEFQFYILVGLIFPALNSGSSIVRSLALAALGLAAVLVPAEPLVFHFLFLFLCGIVTFQFRSEMIGRNVYLVTMSACAVGMAYTLGPAIAAVGFLTGMTIAFVRLRSRAFYFLGAVSYPLYLLHGPIGGRVINLLDRFSPGPALISIGLATAIASSIGAAWLLHKFVEVPSRELASRISYRYGGNIRESASL